MRKPTARRGSAVSLRSSQRRTRDSFRSSSGEIEKSVWPSNGSTSRQLRPPRSIIDSQKPSDRCSAVSSLIAAVASCSRLDRAPARQTFAPSDVSEDRTLSTASDGSKTSSASPGAVNQGLLTSRMIHLARTALSNGRRPGTTTLSDQRQNAVNFRPVFPLPLLIDSSHPVG